MKKSIRRPFAGRYKCTIDAIKVAAPQFNLTSEDRIHIALTVICEIYENEIVTPNTLKNLFMDLSDLYEFEIKDLIFCSWLQSLSISYLDLIIEYNQWNGLPINSRFLSDFFKYYMEVFNENGAVKIGERFEYLMIDFNVIDEYNIKIEDLIPKAS